MMTRERAAELGAEAFANGIQRTPFLDLDVVNDLAGVPVGHPETLEILRAWTQGWEKAKADQDYQLALIDAETARPEELETAADMWDRLKSGTLYTGKEKFIG